ncbi:DNA gyrase inhibitor YacG [Amylibacter sp.]|nr:DNA gyrase inhibitor YacG [Amylibacter sp.]MDC0121022.1 DNA gyrase inhibitor YacG [Amylibacter sp.]MDC1246775.1 DNA gyrase inhibitor YacG [Amylibacter sp.]MDC1495233.1 DNA gyrase inhibitor YacG [Amylibacter sp.]
MACPMCNKSQDKKYRPFCSKRCADLDLGKWLTESYSIPAVETDEEDSIPTEFIPNESNLH